VLNLTRVTERGDMCAGQHESSSIAFACFCFQLGGPYTMS